MGLTTDVSVDGSIEGVDNSDGSMDHGWAAYLTLYSAESNLKPDGTAKINLNGNDLQKLYDDLKTALDEPSAQFIVAYRAYGPSKSKGPAGQATKSSGQSLAPGELDVSKLKASVKLTSVLDLIGATVQVPVKQASGESQGSGGNQGQQGASNRTTTKNLASPFAEDTGSMTTYLPKLMDAATVSSAETTRGRININQAPGPC